MYNHESSDYTSPEFLLNLLSRSPDDPPKNLLANQLPSSSSENYPPESPLRLLENIIEERSLRLFIPTKKARDQDLLNGLLPFPDHSDHRYCKKCRETDLSENQTNLAQDLLHELLKHSKSSKSYQQLIDAYSHCKNDPQGVKVLLDSISPIPRRSPPVFESNPTKPNIISQSYLNRSHRIKQRPKSLGCIRSQQPKSTITQAKVKNKLSHQINLILDEMMKNTKKLST